jgi:hypothetical protein
LVSFTPQLLCPQEKSHWYAFGRRLGGNLKKVVLKNGARNRKHLFERER